VKLADGDEVTARLLTLWDPPRFLPGCSQATLTEPSPTAPATCFTDPVVALVLSLIPRLGRRGWLQQILREGEGATAQTTLRWTVAKLLLLLLIPNAFGLDVVLGASRIT
jgi:hypothetical protein